MNFLILENLRFGRLIAKKIIGKNKYGNYLWECVCDCGNIKIVSSNHLKFGTKSCGCLRLETTINRSFKHGHCRGKKQSKTHLAWYNMKRRCYYQKSINYANYGGRGLLFAKGG